MGGVSLAIAKAFKEAGGDIYCECPTKEILVGGGKAMGLKLDDNSEVAANTILANPTPRVTYEKLVNPSKNLISNEIGKIMEIIF